MGWIVIFFIIFGLIIMLCCSSSNVPKVEIPRELKEKEFQRKWGHTIEIYQEKFTKSPLFLPIEYTYPDLKKFEFKVGYYEDLCKYNTHIRFIKNMHNVILKEIGTTKVENKIVFLGNIVYDYNVKTKEIKIIYYLCVPEMSFGAKWKENKKYITKGI